MSVKAVRWGVGGVGKDVVEEKRDGKELVGERW